jgi:hypothetical protein
MDNKNVYTVKKGSKTLKNKRRKIDPRQKKKDDLIYYYIPLTIATIIFIVDIVMLVLMGLGIVQIGG